MYVRRIKFSQKDLIVHILGVRHECVHDTRYVVSKLCSEGYDLALIEKHPEIDLRKYREQTRRIVGHLNELNIPFREIDEGFKNEMLSNDFDDSLDGIKTENREWFNVIEDIREKVRRNSEEAFNEMFLERESVMVDRSKEYIESVDPNSVCIVVGEIHINSIYRNLISRYESEISKLQII